MSYFPVKFPKVSIEILSKVILFHPTLCSFTDISISVSLQNRIVVVQEFIDPIIPHVVPAVISICGLVAILLTMIISIQSSASIFVLYSFIRIYVIKKYCNASIETMFIYLKIIIFKSEK